MRRLLIALVICPAVAGSASPENTAIPRVSFVHSGLIEGYCSAVSDVKPNPAVLEEIDSRIGEFEAAWAKDGPRLMAGTVEIVGQPYRYRETLATLHGCPDLPSFSMPLLIAAARYTKAWANQPGPREAVAGIGGISIQGPRARREVSPMSSFTYTVWHEGAHRYVQDIVRLGSSQTTPLLRKYAGEPPVVRNHLHLLAIEKLLYTRLGRDLERQKRIAYYRESSANPYVRAYEIVDQEGADRFVAELAKYQPDLRGRWTA